MTIEFTINITTPDNRPLICYLAGMGSISKAPIASGAVSTISLTSAIDLSTLPFSAEVPTNIIISDLSGEYFFELQITWTPMGLDYLEAFPANYNTSNTIRYGSRPINPNTVGFSLIGSFINQ